MPMHLLDHVVVVAYLAANVLIGVLASGKASRKEFFAAGGGMGLIPVGLSVMATLFSSNGFVFYSSAAFRGDLRIGITLLAVALMTPLVAWVFIPMYVRLQCTTAYDYLERRFNLAVRCLASGLFILLRIGWMAAATYAAALVISSISGMSLVTVILTLGVVSIIYTIFGGLRAVMWTDVFQFLIFTSTIAISVYLIASATGQSGASIFGDYIANKPTVFVDFTPSMTLTHGSWAVLIGVFLEALGAFGADQVAVQRYLSARDEKTAQRGAWVNMVGMFFVIPGLLLIGVALSSYYEHHPEEVAKLLTANNITPVADEVQEQVREPKMLDKALPYFVVNHFPPGMIGLFLAALMAAIMSSIDSGIHSVATAVIVDFRDRLLPGWRPEDERRDVGLIRVLIVLIGTASMVLACFVNDLGDVFKIAKMLTSAFGAPLLAVFILALFVPRAAATAILISALSSAAITLWLMTRHPEWYAFWYWPIGFGLAFVGGWVLSPLFRPGNKDLTYWAVVVAPTRIKEG